MEVLLLGNTDYCRKQPFTPEVPFRVPTVVTLSLVRRLKDRERFLSPKLKSESNQRSEQLKNVSQRFLRFVCFHSAGWS